VTALTGPCGPQGDSGGVAYSRDFGDGTAVSHEARPRHTYAKAGTFTATLKVSYADGTTSTTKTRVRATGSNE
jgi:PKD repeat protein